MTLYQGDTKIDAVYFGAPGSGLGVTNTMVTYEGSYGLITAGTIKVPANVEGDLIIFLVQANDQVSTPSNFSIYQSYTTGSGVSKRVSTIFYRFAPAGGQGDFSSPNAQGTDGGGVWVFRGVHKDTPFGAYASSIKSGGTPLVIPGVTPVKPNGYGLVCQVATGSGANFPAASAGYSEMVYRGGNTYTGGYFNQNRALTSVPSLSSGSGSGGTNTHGHTFELIGAETVSNPVLATAVYLGVEKVWPIYVANLSPWYTPSTAGGTIDVPWPFGATAVDVVMVGGGAGGTGTGIGGNPPRGGGEGPWSGVTITNQAANYDRLVIRQISGGNMDGVGGGNFNTDAADGSKVGVTARYGASGQLAEVVSGQGLDKNSNTGNRNGGNVPETFTFNGRTFTMASYGVNAGRGGATSNKNGGPGNLPGGGGQSADNGGLTGYNGGNGAHGAAILYWY